MCGGRPLPGLLLQHSSALVVLVVALLQPLPRQCSCGPPPSGGGAEVLAAAAQALVRNYSATPGRLQGTLEVLERVVVSAPGESHAYGLAAPEVSNITAYLGVRRAAVEMAGALEAVAAGGPATPGTDDVHARALQAAEELVRALRALPSLQQSYPMTRRAIMGAVLRVWLTSRVPVEAWPSAVMDALYQVMVEVREGGGGMQAGRQRRGPGGDA